MRNILALAAIVVTLGASQSYAGTVQHHRTQNDRATAYEAVVETNSSTLRQGERGREANVFGYWMDAN